MRTWDELHATSAASLKHPPIAGLLTWLRERRNLADSGMFAARRA